MAAKLSKSKVLDDLDLIPREDFARAVGRSVRMLKRDWTLRRGPRPIRYGHRIFYRKSDIRQALEKLARTA